MPVNDASPSAPSMMSIGLLTLPARSSCGSMRATSASEKAGTSRPLAVTQIGRDRAVPAAVGDHGDAAAAGARRANEGLAGVDEVARRVDAHDAGLTAGGGDHGVARDERTGVRGGAAGAGGRAAAVEEHDGLHARGGARGLDEGASVGHVLGVDGDRARRLVAGQVLDELREADVGLVADRGEARQPEAAALEQHADLEREVARLRDQARPARPG